MACGVTVSAFLSSFSLHVASHRLRRWILTHKHLISIIYIQNSTKKRILNAMLLFNFNLLLAITLNAWLFALLLFLLSFFVSTNVPTTYSQTDTSVEDVNKHSYQDTGGSGSQDRCDWNWQRHWYLSQSWHRWKRR